MSAVSQRPRLLASQRAGHALVRRRHEETLQALRVRVEDDPHSGLSSRLSRAEQQLLRGDLAGAGDTMIEVGRSLDQRAEQRATDAAIDSTVALALDRGEVVERECGTARAAGVRILTRDGLLWLKQKKRLGTAELAGLERYRDLFAKAHRGPAGSAWDSVGPGSRSGDDRIVDRVDTVWRLDDARRAVGHDQALVWLLDEVAGRGATLRDLARGDRHAADRLEAELRVAARMLARWLGLKS